jgi:predicted DNA-binding protein with PD1-like motif
MFLAGFSEAEIVGTCEKPTDPHAPVWTKVHLEDVEAMGCGTLAYDPENDHVMPHIHTSLGLKLHSASGHMSHLLSARVLFLVELLIVEVAEPAMSRLRNPQMYDVPLLTFSPNR